MNIKKIKELVELMNENDLTEIEVEQEGVKIKLTKKAYGAVERTIAPVVEVREAPGSKSGEEPQSEQKRGREVKTPMVGTFYRAPSPEAKPYVKVGDVVQKGDVLCIVEAMKMMNEIKAEFSGKIEEISVEDGAPVEFGQSLFLINTD